MSKSTSPVGEEQQLRDTREIDADIEELTPEELIAVLEQAEADAAKAEARAVAARAKARAVRVHAKTGQQSSGTDPVADATEEPDLAPALHKIDGGRRRQRIRTVSCGLALLCSVAMLAVSGYIVWAHDAVTQEQRTRAEYAAAAKQAVVTLMSIDSNDPQAGVQRIIDNSVDPFRAEFEGAADDFVKVATDAKVTTKATANAAAVQTASPESAVVLVSASSTVTNAAGAQEAPRSWRLTVDLKREGDQIKMSKVEFVP